MGKEAEPRGSLLGSSDTDIVYFCLSVQQTVQTGGGVCFSDMVERRSLLLDKQRETDRTGSDDDDDDAFFPRGFTASYFTD